jgi:putative transposase
MRKHHSSAFKAQVVRELLKEEKSISQLATEYDVHPNQLYRWRDVAISGLPRLFSGQ